MSAYGILAGVLAPVGKARAGDLEAFSRAKLNLIRLRAQVNPLEDLLRWQDAGAVESILHLLSPHPGQHTVSVASYVDEVSNTIEDYVSLKGRFVEIHDEPNRRVRGAGVSWQDGVSFSAWFSSVTDRLRSRFGDALQLGFPAFSPARMPRPQASAPFDDETYLNACRDSLAVADWAALHIYWRTREDMRAYDGALRFLRMYLERYPEQQFIITEYANVTPDLPAAERGQQYNEFITLMSQFPQIAGICGLLLRSHDPELEHLSWINAENTTSTLIDTLGTRRELPDPRQLWFTWPTDTRKYVHRFGESQRAYYASYHLSGGHNGVDLSVNPQSPVTSPIYTAYPGTVQQVAMDESGYTRHVHILGYGPDQRALYFLYAHLSTVEVTPGTLVKRGDVLGWGSAATSHTLKAEDNTAPYMHFSLRVEGIDIPATSDWVNPQPYLDTVPRGMPVHGYKRTYVLLPQDTAVAWLSAAVRAVWGQTHYVFGCNPDDAGIGDLASRRVIAVNPEQWPSDLEAFFQLHYPGVEYVPMTAATPADLENRLNMLPRLGESPADIEMWIQGQPRLQYARKVLLLPPAMPISQVKILLEATWKEHSYTMGSSVNDAAVGDLSDRTIIAVLPEAWKQDLAAYYDYYYPGVTYFPVAARTFSDLLKNVKTTLESG